jgi:hypothetical protein
MATRSPSLLWNITQPLDANEKAQARSNAGVLLTKNANTGNAFEFIYECTTVNGDVKYNTRTVPVESNFSSSGTNPVNGTAIDKALDTLKIDGGISITAGNYITKITETKGIIGVEQAAMDISPVADSKKPITSGAVKTAIDTHKHGNIKNDGTIAATSGFTQGNDALLIADASDSGKLVKSSITFNTSAADKDYTFLSKGGEWKSYSAGVDLKFTAGQFAVDTTSTIDEHSFRSFVIGANNAIKYADDCFAGGNLNTIGGMNASMIFGGNNIIGNSNISGNEDYGNHNIIFGNSNTVTNGKYNNIIGLWNSITVGNTPAEGKEPLRNIVIGYNNHIGGNASGVYGHDTILIGNSLSWSEPNYSPLILGVYNSETWRYKSQNLIPLRITGGGLSDNPKNVEVMYTDGLIWSNSGFEVSDDTDGGSSTYLASIYKLVDSNTLKISGAGVRSLWTHKDDMGSGRILSYSETSQITNAFMSVTAAKNDSSAVVPGTNPEGTVNLTGIAQQLLKRTPKEEHDPSDKTYSAVLEFSSSSAGGNVGLTMGSPALPSWNIKDARSTTDISVTWLKVYGNRNAAGDSGGDILPSDNSVPSGNLEVGKIAVKFYRESELTESNPLIPGQKVGDISFIVGDPALVTHGFYIYDSNDYAIGHASHFENAYINTGYKFCMLMTTEASTFVNGLLSKPGAFSCLYC